MDNSKEMVDCLKKIDGEEFVNGHREMTVNILAHRMMIDDSMTDRVILGTSKRCHYRIRTDD